MSKPLPLAPQWRAFLESGVGILVSTVTPQGAPLITMASACIAGTDGTSATLLMARSESAAVMDALRTVGRVAVVFSQPTTHRTIQLKGNVSTIEDPTEEQRNAMEKQVQRFLGEVVPLGFSESYARNLCGPDLPGMQAVTFTIKEAFLQTPGPDAGAPLRS